MCLRVKNPISHSLVLTFLLSGSTKNFMQFILDCSAMPKVIRYAQLYGNYIYDDLFLSGQNMVLYFAQRAYEETLQMEL